MFNKVILIGRLVQDPEIKAVNGTKKTTMRIASNRKFTDKEGTQREETLFVDVEVWGARGEPCYRYLSKGRLVLVEGRLSLDQWKSPEGYSRSKHYIRATNVVFLDREKTTKTETDANAEEEIPF